MSGSPYHDAELADTLEAERLRGLRLDPEAQVIAARVQALVGQRLLAVRVVPLGVMFEFENATYWAYGGPRPRG